MGTPNEDLIKDLKTLGILTVTAGISYAITGDGFGHVITLGIVGALTNYMHSVGRERRVGSNVANTVTGGSKFYNAYRNVSNGGDKMFNDARKFISTAISANTPASDPSSLTRVQEKAVEEIKGKYPEFGNVIEKAARTTYAQVNRYRG